MKNKIIHWENFLIRSVHGKTILFVCPSKMPEIGYMAYPQKMLHTFKFYYAFNKPRQLHVVHACCYGTELVLVTICCFIAAQEKRLGLHRSDLQIHSK